MALDSNTAHEMVLGDLADLLATQEWRKTAHLATSQIAVAAGKTESLEINVGNDGDFHSETLTGKIIPTNSTTTTGLLVQIFDNNSELTDGFIPLENILSPGYGAQVFFPHKLEHIFERNAKIRFNVQNISAESQSVSFVLSGEKLH